MRLGSRSSDVICLGALLVLVAGICLVPVTETDVFFRLKVGQEIWARRGLLGENLFSFTAPHHPDLDASWAFEVALAGLYRLGGFPAIVMGKTAVMVGVFGAAYALCRRQGCAAATTLCVLAAAAAVMSARFVERPHLVSFAGEVVVSWAVASPRRAWGRRRLVAFAAAMGLWANAHAGIFVGVGVLLLAAVGEWPGFRAAARRAREGPTEPPERRSPVPPTLILGGLAAIAAFATPLGFGIVRYWSLHVHIPRLHPVDEFRAATWRSEPYFFIWIIALAVCFGVEHWRGLLGWRCAGRAREAGAIAARAAELRHWLPAAGLVGLGWSSVRFSADAVLMTAPLLARGCQRSAVWWVRRQTRTGGTSDLSTAPILSVAAASLVMGLVLASRVGEHSVGRRWFDIDIDREQIPDDAIDFVERAGLREHMYNDYELGSYLAFQGFPRYRVFVDPRLPAYPEEMHRLLGRFDVGRAEWDAAMERHGVDSALLTYAGINRRVSWWDPQRWALIYRRADARVFVRRLARWRPLIARLEIPTTFSFTIENGTTTIPLLERPTESPVAECEWQHRLGDLLFELDPKEPRVLIAYRRALQERACLSIEDEGRLSAWVGSKELAAGEPRVRATATVAGARADPHGWMDPRRARRDLAAPRARR